MRSIDKRKVDDVLQSFAGHIVYVHCEVTPGGFMRNVRIDLQNTFIAGDGPYRVALKFAGDGWIRMEGLTDYEVDHEGRLLMAGHDDLGRLTTALELCKVPFEA